MLQNPYALDLFQVHEKLKNVRHTIGDFRTNCTKLEHVSIILKSRKFSNTSHQIESNFSIFIYDHKY